MSGGLPDDFTSNPTIARRELFRRAGIALAVSGICELERRHFLALPVEAITRWIPTPSSNPASFALAPVFMSSKQSVDPALADQVNKCLETIAASTANSHGISLQIRAVDDSAVVAIDSSSASKWQLQARLSEHTALSLSNTRLIGLVVDDGQQRSAGELGSAVKRSNGVVRLGSPPGGLHQGRFLRKDGIEVVILHEALHQLGVRGHVDDPGDVMTARSGPGFATMRGDYVDPHVIGSPYTVALPAQQQAIDVERARLRASGQSIGLVESGPIPLNFDRTRPGRTKYVQYWSAGAIGVVDCKAQAVTGKLFSTWQESGGIHTLGLPVESPRSTAMGTHRRALTQQFENGRLHAVEPIRTIGRTSGLAHEL